MGIGGSGAAGWTDAATARSKRSGYRSSWSVSIIAVMAARMLRGRSDHRSMILANSESISRQLGVACGGSTDCAGFDRAGAIDRLEIPEGQEHPLLEDTTAIAPGLGLDMASAC